VYTHINNIYIFIYVYIYIYIYAYINIYIYVFMLVLTDLHQNHSEVVLGQSVVQTDFLLVAQLVLVVSERLGAGAGGG